MRLLAIICERISEKTIITKHDCLFSSFLTDTTAPTNTSESLAGWKIALIIVGSILGVLLLGGIIGLILWKCGSKPKYQAETPLEFRSPSNEQTIRNSIPQTKYTDLRQRSSSPFTHRKQKQSSSHDDTIRPTIPQITSTSYDLSNGQEARRNQQRVQSSNYEQYSFPSMYEPTSISPDVIYQHQIPRGRQRPLPPLTND
ncbi:unnamed protein product [Rotaria sp. Silwood1]|nr:unnamed protein product [Rotaria sp. Silwood1]